MPPPPASSELSKPSRLSPTTPIILGCGVLAIVGMLVQSHRSAVRSERAMGSVMAAQKLLLAHAALRARVGPIVASGSYSMDCSDTRASGWFRTAVMGGDAPSAGRAYLQASRPAGSWADALGMGQERPWAVDGLKLEVDVTAMEERAAARLAVAVKAGYASSSSSSSSSSTAIREALLSMGGVPMEEGALIELDVVTAAPAASSAKSGLA